MSFQGFGEWLFKVEEFVAETHVHELEFDLAEAFNVCFEDCSSAINIPTFRRNLFPQEFSTNVRVVVLAYHFELEARPREVTMFVGVVAGPIESFCRLKEVWCRERGTRIPLIFLGDLCCCKKIIHLLKPNANILECFAAEGGDLSCEFVRGVCRCSGCRNWG